MAKNPWDYFPPEPSLADLFGSLFELIVSCAACGARNRVKREKAARARCGKCGLPLKVK